MASPPKIPSFKSRLYDLIREHRPEYAPDGNVNLKAFWSTVEGPGFSYEYGRKLLEGSRVMKLEHLLKIAKSLGVDPTVFAEYKALVVLDNLDPAKVGVEGMIVNGVAYYDDHEGDLDRAARSRAKRTPQHRTLPSHA